MDSKLPNGIFSIELYSSSFCDNRLRIASKTVIMDYERVN